MIEVYLPSLFPEEWKEDANVERFRSLAGKLADIARAQWLTLAAQRLHTSQQEYSRAISQVDHSEEGVAAVRLVGVFPNMIEEGFDAHDQRDSLLGPNVPVVDRGRGKRMAKDGGFYRYIFFRIGGSTTSGRNHQRAGDLYAQFLGEKTSKILGRKAMKMGKGLSATVSNPGEPTQWGKSLITEGTDLDVKGRSHALDKTGLVATAERSGVIRHGGAEHKSPLFEGMYRFEQTYRNKTQNFYGTFRTISTNSPDGWIHPGYQPGAHLAEEANEHALALATSLMFGEK